MRGFSELHPAVTVIYFIAAAGISMFSMDPVILSLSFLGSITLFCVLGGNFKTHIFSAAVLLISAIMNPLFYHNGATVLFMINDSRITLEALVYGIFAGMMIVSALYWFMSLTRIMTSDKWLCVFGKLSPKFSLVLSMTMRFVPLFSRQVKKVTDAQRAIGMYREDNIIDSIKGGARVFSVMTTWALENGIVTADSMEARGYGIGKRSRYPKFRFRFYDLIVLPAVALLALVTIFSMLTGAFGISFYPTISFAEASAFTYAGAVSYGLLVFMPVFIEAKEAAKWRYLTSGI